PWITVKEDKVIRPDGKPGIYGTVNMIGGISVLPIDEEGFVYLTEEFKYAIGRNSIEVVSGGIDKGESPLEAAKRELKEELGIEAEEWTDLGSMDPFTSVVSSPATLFLARKLKFSDTNPEGTEKIKVLKVKFEEAVQMVMDSKITHGQSCVLLLKSKVFLTK
ncbi:NUDIX hydrolase, partial [Candidatus Woesearchaeota archaeon]|nr:NUDIX hydrolase [Candidatus Woesearchaeota archaeon]